MIKKTYPADELLEIPVHDRLHNLTIDIGKPDTHVGTHDQEPCEDQQVEGFTGLVAGHCNFDKDLNALDEYGIYVSFTALLYLSNRLSK